MNKKSLNVHNRITIYTILISIVCFGLLGVVSYRQISTMMIDQCKQDAMGLATVAASEIDGDWHADVMDNTSDTYQVMYDIVAKYRGSWLIEYIYTMRLDEDGLKFIIDTDPEEPAEFLEPYELLEDMKPAFEGTACADKEMSADKWGAYFSAYAPIFDENGNVAGIVGTDIDISDIHKKLKGLQRLLEVLVIFFMLVSLYLYIHTSKLLLSKDALTLVDNYDTILEVGNQLKKKNKLQDYVGILVNIKDFKYINQEVSSAYGDVVLQKFAMLLSEQIRYGERLARTGSDNFFALIKKGREQDFLEDISVIDSIHINYEGADKAIPIHTRCGVCVISEAYKISQVLNYCNLAISVAHEATSEDVVWYKDTMSKDMVEEKKLLADFKQGLKKHEFVVYYQPKVNIKKNELCGAEALVRWMRDGKLVPPDSFIPVLEKEGKITDLDFYVLEQVCKDIKAWLGAGITPVRISSNFSKLHLDNSNFAERVVEIAEKHGVPLEYLDVELTESSGYTGIEELSKFIKAMREKGIYVSMDDFGTGYSSLAMLKDVEVNVVKIDKSFFRNMKEESDVNAKMIENVIKMINDLNRIVICEGVETKEQAEFLRGTDCYIVQGYLFDRPLPLTEFVERLRQPKYNAE